MFKPIVLALALAAITSTFNLHAADSAGSTPSDAARPAGTGEERGPWPALFPGGRFLPSQVKYFEEQGRKSSADRSASDGRASSPFPSSVNESAPSLIQR